MENRIIFAPFKETDITVLTPIMKRAFDEDTRLHTEEQFGGPNGYDDGTLLYKMWLDKKYTMYTIYVDKDVIGLVSLHLDEEGKEHKLDLLFTDVYYRAVGLGTKIWSIIEVMHPDAVLWKTETPIYSTRNYHFYIDKCGFTEVEAADAAARGSILFEKRM